MSTYTDIRYDYNLTSGFGGGLTLLSTQTASSYASISFTSGIDSSYLTYLFKFINIHPQNETFFEFNLSTDSGSNYNVTKTSTWFYTYHEEDDTATGLSYSTPNDLAQSTSYQPLHTFIETDDDEALSGYLHLFDPSSTTYVKHYMSTLNKSTYIQAFVAGYGNTTSAINAIDFKMSSGNIDAGTIQMFGIL